MTIPQKISEDTNFKKGAIFQFKIIGSSLVLTIATLGYSVGLMNSSKSSSLQVTLPNEAMAQLGWERGTYLQVGILDEDTIYYRKDKIQNAKGQNR
jgi:antitoxin component of MazEF toxin-antitoxin module